MLFAVLFLFFQRGWSQASILCENGRFALVDEENQLFRCLRGCPDTFYCEKQQNLQICCPNVTAISTNLQPIEFQLDDFEKSTSCERYPYKLSCANSTNSQPQAKWYYNVQTLSCEMYPFGSCHDDPIAKFAIRSQEECNEKCDVEKLRNAIANLEEGNLIVEAPSSRPGLPNPNLGPVAIDDVVQESKHIRGRPFAIEPPTDLVHVIHIPNDNEFPKELNDDLLTTDATVTSTVSSDPSPVPIQPTPVPTEQLHTVSSTVSSDPPTVPTNLPTVPSTVTSPVLTVNFETAEGSGLDENEVENDDKVQKRERIEESFERFYQESKSLVACRQTAYRVFCTNGYPSQFVYRWESIDGICQSFPFGYCYGEKNVAHPRTKLECEEFCN